MAHPMTESNNISRRYLLYGSESYAVAILRPLQAAIRRAGGETAWFFDGPGADLLDGDERLLDIDEARRFAPRAVFVPGNHVAHFIPGVKVEIFHGFSVGKRSDTEGHFRIRGLFDLYCTQGSTTTKKFEELAQRHGHFHVVETGWPKIDPLFHDDGTADHWRDGFAGAVPLVLFASTFTRSLTAAPHLFPKIRELAAGGRWNWLVTLHPKMDPEIVREYRELEGPRLRFVENRDVLSALKAADVIVSDTSSIVPEFLMQHRPAVTFRNRRPGPQLIDIQDPAQLEAALERAVSRPPELMAQIEAFTAAVHPYRDGRSSERVLAATEEFIELHRQRLRPKPWNAWRKFKVRRRLDYWR